MYVGEKCQLKMKAEPFEEMPWQQVQTDYPAQGLSLFSFSSWGQSGQFFLFILNSTQASRAPSDHCRDENE